ncbi:MAG: hypothetical protein ACE5K9_08245 [Candidatus Methylomirabilales bacterium]
MPLGAIFLAVALSETTIASNEVNGARAFGIAEAGIEHARREPFGQNVNGILAANPPLINFTAGGQNVSFGGGAYTVTVRNTTPPL